MSKPREFWLNHIEELQPDDTLFKGNRYLAIDWPLPKWQEQIHTIEHSAYADLLAQNAALRKVLETCREAVVGVLNSGCAPQGGHFSKLLSHIEQTLSKGETE